MIIYHLVNMSQLLKSDKFVKVVSDFYHFLTTFPYLPAFCMKVTPQNGWPCRESLNKLQKSAEVLVLLCHLPYLDTSDREKNFQENFL